MDQVKNVQTMALWDQIVAVLRSRKFWALVGALVAVAAGYFTGSIDAWQAIQAVIAALAVYSTGVAIEDINKVRG